MIRTAFQILLVVWRLPTNIFGHAAGFLFSGFKFPERLGGANLYCGTLKVPGFRGAIVFGDCILYREGFFDGLQGRIVLAHELAHVPQHLRLGPFYLPCHIISQLLSAIISYLTNRKVSFHDYNFLENVYISLPADAYLLLTRLHCKDEALSERDKMYMYRRGLAALLRRESLIKYFEDLGIEHGT